MTDVHQRTSSYSPAIARTRLADMGVVELRVPKDAEFAELDTGQGTITYLRFKRNIKGGHIPCYLHTRDTSLAGKTVFATFELFERTHEDNSRQLHVDFRLTDLDATHRLFFLPKDDLPKCERTWPRFQVSQKLPGFVVIAPADAKIKQPAEVAHSATEDPQLDRLLRDGWSIKEDKGNFIILTKNKSGSVKTITHHKPKR